VLAAVRTRLQEMPELGISARGSYAIQEGSSISEVYHELAGTVCILGAVAVSAVRAAGTDC
jgi:hypothetical protein